jgi:hypothetical protein
MDRQGEFYDDGDPGSFATSGRRKHLHCPTALKARPDALANFSHCPTVSNNLGRGPPGANGKAASAANAHGLQSISKIDARTLHRSDSKSKRFDDAITNIYRDQAASRISEDEAERRVAELRKRRDGVARRQRPPRAETAERWRKRRAIAATSPLPPAMAAHLTTSQMAYARLVYDETKIRGHFKLSHKEVADRCGMCPKTAQRAQERLDELGWIKVEKRFDPIRRWRSLPNMVKVIDPGWLMWISRGPRPRPSQHGHSSPTPAMSGRVPPKCTVASTAIYASG